jgi:hypothetical protein
LNNSIRVHLKDINNTGELPPDLTIQCSAVPHVGEVINAAEILPEENLNESGWWYNIERVEWTMFDDKVFEPVLTLRKDKI